MVETPELSDVNQHTENTPFTMVFCSPRTTELASLGLNLPWPCREMAGQIQTLSTEFLAIPAKPDEFPHGCKGLQRVEINSTKFSDSRSWLNE